MTSPAALLDSPYDTLLTDLGIGAGDNWRPDDWLASVDQPTTPPAPADGGRVRNEPHTVVAQPGSAASGGSIPMAIDAAMKWLGTMYDWGGNGQNGRGVDCSGLLYAAFKAAGFNVQRYRAVDYGHMGTPVDPQDARPGDVVYFDNPGTDTDHVGIYLGGGQFIESPQPGEQVRISKLREGAQIRRIFPEGAYGDLPTSPAGHYVYNAPNGDRYVAPGKGAHNDPVSELMGLNLDTNPDSLIAGLEAAGSAQHGLSLLNRPDTHAYAAANQLDVGPDLHSWVKQALTHMGLPLSYAAKVEYVAMHESSGDPGAINDWDSNAKAGHPTEGLMQDRMDTFEAYRDPALPNDIFNPVSNIVASLRYAIARYGSINNIPGLRSAKYVGY